MNRRQRRLNAKSKNKGKKRGGIDPAARAEVDNALNLGFQNHQAGMLDQAAELYKKALSLDPDNTEANHLLGVIAQVNGDVEAALELIGRAVKTHPGHFTALNNLGNAQAQAGLMAEAEKSYRKALKFKPDYALAHGNLGKVLKEAGRLDDAMKHLARSLQLEPDNPETHASMGDACLKSGLFEDARKHFELSLKLIPHDAVTLNRLGFTQKELGLFDGAEASMRRALEFAPEADDIHNNLGVLLQDGGRLDEAEARYRRALELNPDYIEAHINLGNLMEDRLDFTAAEKSFHDAIQLDPGQVDAHRNLGMLLLRNGDFENGYREYDWRVSAHERDGEKGFQGKAWDGGDIAGRKLLIHAEQGLGDTIQFARYLPLLSSQGHDVVFECQPALSGLMETLAGEVPVIARGDRLPAFDIHAPLLSLPGLLNTTLETVPGDAPYLSAPDEYARKWRERIGDTEELKVGLVWRGRTEHLNDRNRSASLDLFNQHLGGGDTHFFCLQKELPNGEAQMPEGFENIGRDFDDFCDTAAAIMCLDLMISVDTSVVHLAGALAVPTWCLLPTPPDWRWLMDRDDTPWYPSMRLFRKSGIEPWDRVLDRVAQELGSFNG